jgi:hypothetical protein
VTARPTPPGLRHAAISMWLNSRVPAAEVASRAGADRHPAGDLRVHRPGRPTLSNMRITDALGIGHPSPKTSDERLRHRAGVLSCPQRRQGAGRGRLVSSWHDPAEPCEAQTARLVGVCSGCKRESLPTVARASTEMFHERPGLQARFVGRPRALRRCSALKAAGLVAAVLVGGGLELAAADQVPSGLPVRAGCRGAALPGGVRQRGRRPGWWLAWLSCQGDGELQLTRPLRRAS